MSKPKKHTFSADCLAEKLILLIREQVEMGRPVRSRVPPPSAIKKPMPDPFGVPSCDFVPMKREEDAKEMKELEELQSSCGVAVQLVEMPTATSLHGRRVQVMFHEKETAGPTDKGVLSWRHGKVIGAETVEGGINATIEWEGENVTVSSHNLTKGRWSDDCLGENSWMVA